MTDDVDVLYDIIFWKLLKSSLKRPISDVTLALMFLEM